MTLELAKTVHAEIRKALEQIALEHNLIALPSKAKYDERTFRVNLEVIDSGSPKKAQSAGKFDPQIGEFDLQIGCATPGTICLHHGAKVKILKVNRTKYLFRYLDEASGKGSEWLARFGAFKPLPEGK